MVSPSDVLLRRLPYRAPACQMCSLSVLSGSKWWNVENRSPTTAVLQPYIRRLDKRMPEKEPQFTITDRRKFTAEGELRENDQKATESTPSPVAVQREPEPPEATEEGELIPEPTAAESAQQQREYQTSASRLDEMVRKANPEQAALPAMNFERLVQSL